MTIREAIDICDRQKPNGYTQADKIHWLSQLDRTAYDEVIARHEGAPEEFKGYTEDTDEETRLLADDTHADMYVKWLFAQIDFANAEFGRYNNSMAMFNSLYDSWAKSYARSHMPKRAAYFDVRARRRGYEASGPI